MKLSEVVGIFLKHDAQNTLSYIQDTKHSINKTSKADIQHITHKEIFLVTMDVQSLYQNIDHNEETNTCSNFLHQCNNPSIPTKWLSTLNMLVLKLHTVEFSGRFFQ